MKKAYVLICEPGTDLEYEVCEYPTYEKALAGYASLRDDREVFDSSCGYDIAIRRDGILTYDF